MLIILLVAILSDEFFFVCVELLGLSVLLGMAYYCWGMQLESRSCALPLPYTTSSSAAGNQGLWMGFWAHRAIGLNADSLTLFCCVTAVWAGKSETAGGSK